MRSDADLCQGTGIVVVKWWGAVPTPQIIPALRNPKTASAAWSPSAIGGVVLGRGVERHGHNSSGNAAAATGDNK